MAIGTTTMAIIGIAGAMASAYGSFRQAQVQQQQARAQAEVAKANQDIALQNQQLAEDQARKEARQGYEDQLRTRQEAARIIGQQRAAAGASGAQVDLGGTLDWTLETAEKGEVDALNAYQQGLDAAYNKKLEAWNYGNQAGQYGAQASAYKSQANSISPWLAGGTSLLGGLTQVGMGFGKDLWGVGSASSGLKFGGKSASSVLKKSVWGSGSNWLK